MKKILLVFCLLIFSHKIFAQQFSQYNTGTLYDSFENPAQKSFITDTSKRYAFNFFIPSFNADFFLTGNAQATLKTRAFFNLYDTRALKIDQGKFNQFGGNANAYLLMFKAFQSFDGDTEIGFSWQLKAEGRGAVSDESIALLNGTSAFPNDNYAEIFNDRYYYQMYHQVSFSYREKFNKQFAFGIKVSALLGIQYKNLTIDHSYIAFNKVSDTASVILQGKYMANYIPGSFNAHDLLPVFRNPGAAISIGTSYNTDDNFHLQANIKDLGFIHWSKLSRVYNFNTRGGFYGLSGAAREDSITNGLDRIIHSSGVRQSFVTPINGRAEVSANKSYWIDNDHLFKYSPTLIASKELFYPGFTGALVNPITYSSYTATLTTTYDDLRLFNLGLQFMYKTPKVEFYIGSDRIAQTRSLESQARATNPLTVDRNSPYTGANFFIGFALKFGPVIEHPMNASTVPLGEKGFMGRLMGRIFKTRD
ncbi:MAG: hypothetical protein NVSMB24_23250 [Mucilaginibacter sp.]